MKTWKKKKIKKIKNRLQTTTPQVQPPETKSNFFSKHPLSLCLASAFFFLIGCYMMLHPLMQMDEARFWTVTPAVVISSSVDNTLPRQRRIVIEYQYEFDRVRYTGKRYEFDNMGYNNPDIPEKITADYPAGKKITCYVNPVNPDEAVISRKLPSSYWQHFIFPFVFIATPILFLFYPHLFGKKYKAIMGDWLRRRISAVLFFLMGRP